MSRRAVSSPVARVLTFSRTDQDVLEAVERDCQRLHIPTYQEASHVYDAVLHAYWGTPYNPETLGFQRQLDAAWAKLAKDTGVPPAVFEAFRTRGDYNKGMEAREAYYESGAYLLGLYVARREFPRLGGGVL